MDDIVFWKIEYSENSRAANMGYDGAKIVLKYNEELHIWQNYYHVNINGIWYEAEQHEIADICVNYTIQKVDQFLKNETEKNNAKNEALEKAKRGMLVSATFESGERENAA